jgi:hypothetical protein
MTNMVSAGIGPPGQGQELLAGARVVADDPVERGRDGLGVELWHAAQRYARLNTTPGALSKTISAER